MKFRIITSGIVLGVLGFLSCVRQSVSGEPALSSAELQLLLKEKPPGFHLIDVRTPEEYTAGHIPGAVNIPIDVIAWNPPAAEKGERIVVYCRSGARSGRARQTLLDLGFTDVVNFGAVSNWKDELVTGDKPE
ncbi:MAG: rhodanese-like domain-containing protein [Spirochaetales bacterium]|nr:rhodanese-like domain-containing protein [Spirochaetales bacterium]